MERAHIECEKVRDKHEKLIKEAERMRTNTNAISPGVVNPSDRAEVDRLRDRLEKALQVNQLLYNFLEKHTQNQFQTRDATELEAGRLAKELEKAQLHLAKQQEANESTRIEFERMSAELSRFHERLERSEAEKESLKQSAKMFEKQNMHQGQIKETIMKLEAESKQLTVERLAQLQLLLPVNDDTLLIHFLYQGPTYSTVGEESGYVNEFPTRIKCHRARTSTSTRGE